MEYQQHQHLGMADSVSANKVLRNTYAMLALTLTFSAVCAGISMAMDFGGIASLVMLVLRDPRSYGLFCRKLKIVLQGCLLCFYLLV